MSDLLDTLREALANWPAGLALAAAAAGAVLVALILHRVAIAVLGRAARHTDWIADGALEKHCYRPLQLVLPLLFLRILGGAFPEQVAPAASVAVTAALILSIGWLAVGTSCVLEDSIFGRLRLDAPDNLRARRLYTQLRFLRRLVTLGIAIVTGGAILMSFDSLRSVGTWLLTSAGVVGVVIGFAAQRTVGNLIAGFQIAFTQPIRTDDVVIVEGEWGRIEEITLTYVVVCIWDQRRLVVPISHFIEHPFQNWTRVSADLLATVYLQVDYRAPVDEIRAELERLLKASEHWDGKLWRVHVTEARAQTLELRALMSARDSGSAWELRCEVREGLVRHLQEHHPEALPRLRAELAPLEALEVPPS
jgi:small-conductance mechanosensitive channel